MPRRPTHLAIGSMSGVATGVVTSSLLPREHQLVHVVFAGIGGALGGLAPDVLEPAVSPNHRSLFHSVGAAGGLWTAGFTEWQADCHRAAAVCDTRACSATDGSQERSNEEIKAFLWRALAGLSAGFLAGYASHLVLDAATTRSLPLLINGF